jgi:hypothetical protein
VTANQVDGLALLGLGALFGGMTVVAKMRGVLMSGFWTIRQSERPRMFVVILALRGALSLGCAVAGVAAALFSN